MDSPRKVFLSYRSVDQARVRLTAAALRAAGIDAWLDEWEILPGDNLVTKINQGLETCDVGVVFLSKASLDGKWHQDEITMLKVLAVDEGRPLIPVLLDPDAKVPVILRPYSRLTADQIPQLIDAIMGRTGKPGLGEPRKEPPCRRLVIRLRDLGKGAIGVSADIDGKAVGEETPVRPGPDFEFSYADFLRGRLPGSRLGSPREEAVARERELRKLGEAVGRVVFAGEINRELAKALDDVGRGTGQAEVIFESEAARLLSIPVEAAALSDGRVPALLPAVYVWRRLAGKASAPAPAPPGPLRVLVAVGAPDEGKTPAAVLDSERELQTIFDALERARCLGNAYVRVLEVGSPDEIGAALRERSYHVLHLSGHGNKSVLELEDEDGNPVGATAAELARRIQESGHPAPLVFLASCHGGLGDAESASLAQGLLESGVPAALAMQTVVSDWYATELAGGFYEELARSERPLPSRALALARRALEEERRQDLAKGQSGMGRLAEYATPALFCAGEENAVLDRGLPLEPLQEAPAPLSVGKVPLLKLGDLIGRRRETREIVRVLMDDEGSVAALGRKAGCQILGTGGVGKSTVAGRVMQRMVDRGWRVATVSGAWNLGDVAAAVGAALWGDTDPDLAKAAALLANLQAPDNVRLQWLQAILAQHELLLVLDNFEDVLALGGGAFRDQTVRAVFEGLLGAAQRAKLLVTSRYPLPAVEGALHPVELGPLSPAETRKLMLRHEGLKGFPPESARLIERAIGGHPRTLEYLDALLRQGRARLDRVQVRLSQYAKKAGIRLDGTGSIDERVADAVRVAAADALVDELLQLIGENPADLELLWQASVYPMPVPPEALAFDVASDVAPTFTSAPSPAPEAPARSATLVESVNRLAATSLLTRIDGELFVHRWTAESLKTRMGEIAFQQSCRQGAEYLRWRGLNQTPSLADLVESMRLFLAALEFDKATEIGEFAITFLQRYGQTTEWTELAREVADGLPPGMGDKLQWMLVEGDGVAALGFTRRALECYRTSVEFAERLAIREPDRLDYLRNVFVSCIKMGDLLDVQGEDKEAREFYQKALGIAQRLAAQKPDRAEYLCDLSISYYKMGDLLSSALGQGETARQFYQKNLEIAERLVVQQPESLDYLRNLSISYDRMGGSLITQGQGEKALQFYQKALEIEQRLVAQEPRRAEYLRSLSVAYERIGNLLSAQKGQDEKALEFYQKALEIREQLVAREPDRADYLRELSVPYERIGDLQCAQKGQEEKALQFYQKALEIREQLVAQEPNCADYLRGLSLASNKMGELLHAMGKVEITLQFYQKAMEIAERLVVQEPSRADYLRDLSVCYIRMGDLLRALGEGETARQFYQKALEIAERLAAQEPDRTDYQVELAKSLARTRERANVERALAILTGLADSRRLNASDQSVLQVFRELLRRLKDVENAERLAAQEPDRTDYQVELAKSLAWTGERANAERALAILTKLAESGRLNPSDQGLLPAVRELLRCLDEPTDTKE